MIRFRYQTLRPHLQGPEGLELGPAEGEMTQFLVDDFESLTVVEGAAQLLAQIPEHPNLTKIHSLFEEFTPERQFNTIILEHILEHVESPVPLLMMVKGWLRPGGQILIGVPNANSIHRLVAVKMGLLGHARELNARDHGLGHRRVYTHETLRGDLDDAGLHVIEMGGVFLKPLSNKQIQDSWTEEMIEGFYGLGKDFPEHAAEIYAVTRPR
jgi:2-polyprenyl-3-methyl-5-hydroxy-6-metoxy-1,4-benzoquinol methylase